MNEHIKDLKDMSSKPLKEWKIFQRTEEDKKEDLRQRVEDWLKKYSIEGGDIMFDDNNRYYFIYDEETDNGEGYTATYPEKFYLDQEFGEEVNKLNL